MLDGNGLPERGSPGPTDEDRLCPATRNMLRWSTMSASDPPAARVDFLQSVSLFGGLETDSLARIQGMLVEERFPLGAVICREGEPGRAMYLLHTGEVEVRRANSTGEQIPLVRLGAGEFFGEMTLIEIQPRSATVIVTEPAILYSMTNLHLYQLYREDLNAYILVLQNISRQLSRRLRKADGRICELLSLVPAQPKE